MDKSYVTLEQNVCPICGKLFETNNILLDTRMRERFEHHTVTGWGFCPDCKASLKDGEYLALIGCDNTKSKSEPNGNIKPENAYRTGEIIWMRRVVFARIFNTQLPDDMCFVFVEPEVIQRLKEMVENSNKENNHE